MDKKDWHEAFYAAIRLLFSKENARLKFDTNYQLNKRSLEIDLAIVKTDNRSETKITIGKIFKRYNLFEYKSPDDKLDIDVLFKSVAYACLFKAYGKHV